MGATADQFSNFATSQIVGGAGGVGTALGISDTTLILPTGAGALFPATTNGPFMVLLGTYVSNHELVKCTARSSDTLTIVRAQEGTTAQAWPLTTTVQQVASAGNLANLWTHLQALSFNVKDYGAAGDGTTDDTAAIQATLNALPSAGGTILFPQGNYKVTATISYGLQANQAIQLVGQGLAKIVSTVPEPGSENGILAFTSDSGNTARLAFRHLAISHTNSGLGLLNGLYIIPNNYGGGGTVALDALLIERCTITGASLWGVRLIGTQRGIVLNCTSNSNRQGGLALTGCTATSVLGGDYSSNVTGGLTGDYGISVASSSIVGPSTNILITGVQANNNGRKGIDVHHGHNVHIIGNSCVGNGYSGVYAVMEDSTKDVADITIVGNTIDQTGGNNTLANYPINVGTFGTTGALNAGAFIVANNKIKAADAGTTASIGIRVMTATSGVPPDRVIITGNTVKNGAGSAGEIIFCDNALAIPYVEITGNVLHAASCAYGIIVQAATDVVVANNILRIDSGTATAGIFTPSGANTVITGNEINGSAPTTTISAAATATQRANSVGGTAIADSAYTAPFTVTSGLTVDTKGHWLSLVSGTPTLTSINANVTNTSVSGNDVRGTISFDTQTGTIGAGTALFTVNFAQAYGSTPVILLATGPSNQTTTLFYVSASGTGTFVVRNAASLGVLTGYKLMYVVIG